MQKKRRLAVGGGAKKETIIRPVSLARTGSLYLSESLVVEAVWVFFLLGWGILHSIWKATQLVHGMPNEAASHLTFLLFHHACQFWLRSSSEGRIFAARAGIRSSSPV